MSCFGYGVGVARALGVSDWSGDLADSDYVLQAHHLRREFGSEHFVAVEDVSLDIAPGHVLALLGPNGAGKTTTVKMLSTLLAPTAGTIVVDGIDAVSRPREARRRIGLVLGGDRGFYLRASARDNLLFFSDVLQVPSSLRVARVNEALETVSLLDRAGDRVETFSRGMRQRLHLARGILNSPRLLLLDEPTTGLDPEMARDIRTLIRTLATSGTAILLTTHYLAEAEELADRLVMINHGRVIVSGGAEAIADRSGLTHVTTFSVDAGQAQVLEDLAAVVPAQSVDVDLRHGRAFVAIGWHAVPNVKWVAAAVATAGDPTPEDVVTRRATLEESYLALVAGEVVAR